MDEADASCSLNQCITVPDGGDEWLSAIPARWAVAVLEDESGQPVQLLAMKNLRQAIRHRIELDESPTRRVNWRQVMRKIHLRRVDSSFEADWVYLAAAEKYFPRFLDKLAVWACAWFVNVDPDATPPRYNVCENLTDRPGAWIGPLADKKSASRLIELIDDAFDLCRYDHILAQYPNAKACAYKEMGKCPAPCDGSISIEQYRRMIELSVEGLAHPEVIIEEHTLRMQAAAAELRFESAVKIKSHIEQLRQLGQGVFRCARPVPEFKWISLQPGARAGHVKVFLILPGWVDHIACLLAEPAESESLMELIHSKESEHHAISGRQIGLAARHLFATKQKSGVFVRLAEVSHKTLAAAYQAVSRKSVAAADKLD